MEAGDVKMVAKLGIYVGAMATDFATAVVGGQRIDYIDSTRRNSQAGRREGGSQKPVWTPEVEALARPTSKSSRVARG